MNESVGDIDRDPRATFGDGGDVLDDGPDYVAVPQVSHKWRGERANGLEGAIIHYDAGRTRPTKGADDPDWGARNALAWGQSQGFAYVTVSRSGRIFLPSNMDWNSWGSHAGESWCPITKRDAVSRFYVGFEVNCPGLVYPTTTDPNVFVPWFDAERDDQGNVVLHDGRAKVVGAKPELYNRADIRVVGAKTGNIKPGAYVAYTEAQYQALVGALLWLKRAYPASFRLDLVQGHDEVAPNRKADPGGSFGPQPGAPAMPMADFREELQRFWSARTMS